MTSTLAKLIVHAGLPKCGTSSLQNLFSTENHRVPKELGMIWIGQGLKPWSKGAAATEIMYKKDASIAAIEALQPLPHATYFISSEALCSNTDVLDALARRFSISHVILTVRMPLPMILSEYCWSGWLYRSPREINFSGRVDSIHRTIVKMSRFGAVRLCPIEPNNFSSRFCVAVAGSSLQNLDETAQSFGNMNASIPPALAEALRDAIISAGIGEIPGPMRRFFVSAAMAMEDAEEFRNYMPVAFNATFNSKPLIEGELRKYGTLLSDSGLSLEICEEAVESSRRKLDDLANTPVPDDLTKRKLQVHAERIIARVRDEVPAAWHRG